VIDNRTGRDSRRIGAGDHDHGNVLTVLVVGQEKPKLYLVSSKSIFVSSPGVNAAVQFQIELPENQEILYS
jgi:hypothetical protein